MLELIIVRHGETDSNCRGTYLGWTNVPLNLHGIEQMEESGQKLSGEQIEAIYASPLLRAKESADIIKKHTGARTVYYDGLKERNFGVFDDMTYREIQETYPEDCKKWDEDWINYKIAKGESAMTVFRRNAEAIDDIISRHQEGKVCIVTHLGCIRNLIAHLLHLPMEDLWRFRAHNGKISRIQITDGFAVLTALNS